MERLRGISVASFGVSSLTADEEAEEAIRELQRNAVFKNPAMAAAHLVGAQAEAMKTAAANEGGMGAMMGFMGANMAQNAGGVNAQALYRMAQQQAPADASADGWTCECGARNAGKFCAECGKPRPAAGGWTCACGAENSGKFCTECGKPRPAQARCGKCGWTPDDPADPPKFCPECGAPFGDG